MASDADSVVSRQLNVMEVLMISKHSPIPMRDLTVNKELKKDDEKGLLEMRDTECLQKGDSAHILDITSSKVQIIDQHDLLLKVVEAMKNQG